MRSVIAVGVAGSVGAIARYGLEGFVSRRTLGALPWGTFIVNISGSFALGVIFAALVEGEVVAAPWLRNGLTIGLIGAFTTFSTFTLETLRLVEEGSYLLAAMNAVGSLVLGLVAVFVGVVVGRAV